MDKNYAEEVFRPLQEAKQEAMDEGNASPPTNYIARLEALYGPSTGEIDLEQEVF